MDKAERITSIYNLYVDDLFNYAMYLGFNGDAIMDAIHDIFCKLAADEEKLSGVENIKHYLLRSLKNKLYDIHRTKKEFVEFSSVSLQDITFDIHVTPEDMLIDEEDQRLIKKQITEMLDSLTPKQREMVYLRYVQEYDYIQIAELLDISVNSCRKLMSKAMQNLRDKFGSLILLFLLS